MGSASTKRGKPAAGKAAVKPTAKAGGKPTGGGDDPRRSDRSKRLLDLVMMLMRSRLPVAYREIREQFVAYQTANVEAGLRAFERDKAELLELGVPIRYISAEEDDSLEDGGYVIDLRRMRQPEVHLTPDEVSALVLAASMARSMPGGAYPQIVDLALRKLAFDVPDSPDTPTAFLQQSGAQVLVHVPAAKLRATAQLDETFATFEAATRLRKRVSFTYHNAGSGMTSRRELDPYALVHREGAWLAIGMCQLRKDLRSFRIDRMRDVAMAPKPKSPDFERPAGLDIRAYANRSPWTFDVEPAEDVELRFGPAAADAAAEDFGPHAVRTASGDAAVVAFPCGNLDFAVHKVLAAKGAIVVARGDRLRARLAAEVASVAALYS
ncbi:MAG: WYL domain-containing protein [Myxococcales bacterium]|nr:WYL domain-containing protein [Myxococcales bacterium]